jgi:hypothetical protein
MDIEKHIPGALGRRFKTRWRPRPGLALPYLLGLFLKGMGGRLALFCGRREYLEHPEGDLWTYRIHMPSVAWKEPK